MAEWKMADVLRLALRHEMDNFGEYQKAAKEMENPVLRSMFSFLAEEEKKHVRLIKEKMAEFKVTE